MGQLLLCHKMLKHIFLIFIKPKKSIREVAKSAFRLRDVIFLLFWLGLLRGLLECLWLFAVEHRLVEFSFLSTKMHWWVQESGPFILANILTVYLRWAMYSVVFCFMLKFFGKKSDFAKTLRVFSVILVLYVFAILVNFLHCFLKLKMVHFYITGLFSYSLGVGQLISSCFFLIFVYNLSRYFSLDRISSFLTALLILAIDRIFYFSLGYAYFKMPFIKNLDYKGVFAVGNNLSSLGSVILTFLFLWLGYRKWAEKA